MFLRIDEVVVITFRGERGLVLLKINTLSNKIQIIHIWYVLNQKDYGFIKTKNTYIFSKNREYEGSIIEEKENEQIEILLQSVANRSMRFYELNMHREE